MVVRRSKRRVPLHDVEPDVELVEHLVQKSLEVNPELRGGGKSTHEVLVDLKNQAIARSKRLGKKAKAAEGRQRDATERRRDTMAFFFERKAAELDSVLADVTARERLLQRERQEACLRLTDEAVDFLALMSDFAESDAGQEVLDAFADFIQKLGVSERELLARVRGRNEK